MGWVVVCEGMWGIGEEVCLTLSNSGPLVYLLFFSSIWVMCLRFQMVITSYYVRIVKAIPCKNYFDLGSHLVQNRRLNLYL